MRKWLTLICVAVVAFGGGLAGTATANTQAASLQATYIFHLYLPSVVSHTFEASTVLHHPYVAHVGVVTSYSGEYPSPPLA